MNDEVDVLGSPSQIALMVSLDVKNIQLVFLSGNFIPSWGRNNKNSIHCYKYYCWLFIAIHAIDPMNLA